jgi:hypothetical protein
MKFLIACAIAVLFLQCSKYKDVIKKPDPCRIDFITYQESPESEVNTGKFKYNKWGDPIAIIIDNEQTNAPSLYFQYDKKRRLTAYMAAYGVIDDGTVQDTTFAVLHQYIYKNDKIVGDSSFYMTSLSNRYNNDYGIGKYTYDQWGRVIKYEFRYSWSNEPSEIYTYNYPNENPYINNTSLVGTHPVLMFVNKDYNRTNKWVLETNEYGLPTKFEVEPQDGYFSKGYEFYPGMSIHTVSYNCSNKKWK